jgi:transposase-like protein
MRTKTGRVIYPPQQTFGRPSLYRPVYCKRVIGLGRQGKSMAQIAAAFGVGRATLHNWQQQYPDFAAALARARDLAQAWWEDRGQEALDSKTFQARVWIRTMAARFPEDYSDRRSKQAAPELGSILNSIGCSTGAETQSGDLLTFKRGLQRRAS